MCAGALPVKEFEAIIQFNEPRPIQGFAADCEKQPRVFCLPDGQASASIFQTLEDPRGL